MFEALRSAADGTFVVDEKLQILIWNEAAEEILGFNASDVLGQLCYQVLQGHDEEKRLICKASCHVVELAQKDEPIPNYDISVRTNRNGRRWMNMSIITTKLGENGAKKMIVHLFRDISQKKADERLFRRILEIAQGYHKIPIDFDDREYIHTLIEKLTERERDVLTLLANGLNTQEIAEKLSISSNTVRNHIQRTLRKLQVHSRIEAVTYALQNGLLD